MIDISEKNFEVAIEKALLAGGPDAYTVGSGELLDWLFERFRKTIKEKAGD